MQSTRVVTATCMVVGVVAGFIVACSNILPSEMFADFSGTAAQLSTVHGRIITGRSRTPVDGATIRVIGIPEGGITQSDKNGVFLIPNLPVGMRTVLSVTLPGYVDGIKPLTLVAQIENYVEISLAPVGVVQRASADKSIEVIDGQGARAVFDPGTLVLPDMTPAVGNVEVRLTQFDPSDPGLLDAFPGDFVARKKDGTTVRLATVMPMDITVTQNGQRLNLKPGAKARVEFPIPIPLRDTAPREVAIWSLDESTGIWLEEGTARRSGNIYTVDIPHLSWWNCDTPTMVACVKGVVLSNGIPVAGASMISKGAYTDGWNRGQTTTLSDGTFDLDVKSADESDVTVTTPNGGSAPLHVFAPLTPGEATSPATCIDIGVICVNPDKGPNYCGPNCTTKCAANEICAMGTASAVVMTKAVPTCQTCPVGTSGCGRDCVNTTTDSANCGACGNVCGARQTCIAGSCQCQVTGETMCGGVCTNLNSDAKNCSACGKSCGLGEVCLAGMCKVDCSSAGNPSVILCSDPKKVYPDYCADISQDRANCGACKYSGPAASCGINQICQSGTCLSCGSGPLLPNRCDNGCVDWNTDRNNCGSCAFTCGTKQICQGSMCQPCAGASPDRCNNECVDLTSSAEHCGTCAKDCTNGGKEDSICQASACIACVAPTAKRCGQECVDTLTNRANCGGCGKTCSDAAKERCSSGVCIACAGATPDLCPKTNLCVNLKTDQKNCGTCGFDCGTKMCVAGVCM